MVVTAFVFSTAEFEGLAFQALKEAGLNPPDEEFKSRMRMDTDPRMRDTRDALLSLADSNSKIAVFFGPLDRRRLGIQSLQALQSVLLRNGVDPNSLAIHFDTGIFTSTPEAARLCRLFHYLANCKILPACDSRLYAGIQVADAVAHSFGQIIKARLTDSDKIVDIGGPNTGYSPGTESTLSHSLLTRLRRALFTRPIVYRGEPYNAQCDPVVLDPANDDPVNFGQNPILLGWGVQIAPESPLQLRQAVEDGLSHIWLGCLH